MIQENRKDLETIQTKKEDEILIIRCTKLGLTKREIEVCEFARDVMV